MPVIIPDGIAQSYSSPSTAEIEIIKQLNPRVSFHMRITLDRLFHEQVNQYQV